MLLLIEDVFRQPVSVWTKTNALYKMWFNYYFRYPNKF